MMLVEEFVQLRDELLSGHFFRMLLPVALICRVLIFLNCVDSTLLKRKTSSDISVRLVVLYQRGTIDSAVLCELCRLQTLNPAVLPRLHAHAQEFPSP
jgi:hypothetical protein